MQVIQFAIPGVPVPQSRPRFTTANGFRMAYDEPKCRAYKELVRKIAGQEKIKQAWKTSETCLRAVLIFRLPIPIKWSKKKALKAVDGEIRPTAKNDLDNLVKGVLDGMNGVLYVDDGQIVSLATEKYYGDPMVLVKLEVLENVDNEKVRVPAKNGTARTASQKKSGAAEINSSDNKKNAKQQPAHSVGKMVGKTKSKSNSK